ncbi:Caffeoyl-CoA O-methyltransferase 1 [Bulinus truncatus]|nr:Caffeoyl-CoA O-methyltransferase 1 [Bulinus truncatus]
MIPNFTVVLLNREEYTVSNTNQVSDTCQNILEQTYKTDWNSLFAEGKTIWNLMPGMMSGPLEGQFIKSVVSIQKCKKILDIGMFTGYSALSMAEALPADGLLVTLDQDEYLKELVGGKFFSKSPHGKKIKIKIGQAIDTVKQMAASGEQFDLIFMDADQKDYMEYFKMIG